MIWIELAILLACMVLGARLGGMALGAELLDVKALTGQRPAPCL